MDGASKYVRGDAIAGLIIMAVNIIGGIVIGTLNGLPIGDAFQMYSILTIGDGLVSQIPALIIATSAGVLVTKSASDSNLGDEIGMQVMKGHRAMFTGGVILLLMVLIPGLPKMPFILMAVFIFLLVQRAKQQESEKEAEDKSDAVETAPEISPMEQNLNQFLQNDRIVVEIGVGLINLVEPKTGKGLAERITTLRRDIATQSGFWIPNVRIRDNLQMGVNDYQFLICGRKVAGDTLKPNHLLAINPGGLSSNLSGEDVKDPAFGLDAKWIPNADRRKAEIAGLTVVDCATVMITHLGEALKSHAHELLSREDLQKMLEKLKEHAPTIVAELKPDTLRPGMLHQLLVNLMRENVSITVLEKIVESGIQHASQTKDIDALTEKVRTDIGPIIVDQFRDDSGKVRVILLEPKLEHFLRENAEGSMISLQPAQLEKLVEKYRQVWELTSLKDEPAAALVDSSIRRQLRQTLYRSLPGISFVAYSEVPGEMLIEPISIISFADVFETAPIPTAQPESGGAN